MDLSNVLTVATAAEKKGVTQQTIYNALDRGELTEANPPESRFRFVVKDEDWEDWERSKMGRKGKGDRTENESS